MQFIIIEMTRNTVDDGIVNVFWKAEKTSGENTASVQGNLELTPDVESATFISYAELTEEVVKNWVTDSVDATGIEVGLDNILLEMQTPSTQSGLPW
tara:strand:+ start:230 stop:520 length:291 start_codon:yes stop_codon:yes gene_type:complete